MAFPENEDPSANDNAIHDVETVLNELSGEEIHELLKAQEDQYDGVEVDIQNMHNDVRRFASSLKASLSQWARQEGFWYHHAEPSDVMLVLWIPQTPSTIPDNASHQVGIAAFVVNDKGEVLVVQEKCGPYKDSGLWKMPTGRINQGEGIKEGAIREVREETGINTEFLQVFGFRDDHNAPFGKSDLLFVSMLKPVSFDIAIQDTEISAAKWMAVDEFAAQPKIQQSKLLKDMVAVCVASMDGRRRGFSAIEMPSRKPSVFYCNAIDTE